MRAESIIADAGRRLRAVGIENGPQEARWLLAGVVESHPICSGGSELLPEQMRIFEAQLERRLQGEPLQYVMGTAAFYCIELEVGPGVLIPRPETEQLVELALAHASQGVEVLDLCTGSGAIALAMAACRPDSHFTGVDISPEALAYARRNQQRLQLANVEFLEGDLFAPLSPPRRFGLITANPPYVSQADYEGLERVVRDYEPALALLGGQDGLDLIRRILDGAGRFLQPGGWLLSEIGEEQGEAVRALALKAGFGQVQIRLDYSEKPRFLVAQIG